jgi:signal transduction histidine kinase
VRRLLPEEGAQFQRDLTLSHLLQYSLITVAVVIGLAAVLGWIASGRALRPVHQITAAARAASERNLSARVAPTGPRDELRELAETFDNMLGRLQAAFEGQQRFIANASHELRTPLAIMRATVDVVLGNPGSTPGDLRGMAADIRAAVDHAEHLIGALLILARNEHGLTVREQVDLATTAEDVLDTAPPRTATSRQPPTSTRCRRGHCGTQRKPHLYRQLLRLRAGRACCPAPDMPVPIAREGPQPMPAPPR